MNKQPYKSQMWFQVQETPILGGGAAGHLKRRRRVTEPFQPLDVCTWLWTHLATTNEKTHLTFPWFLFV